MNTKVYINKYITNYKKSYELDYKSQFTKKQTDEWNYEDGCVLIGAWQLYEVTNDEQYRNFILNYVKQAINEDGTIKGFKENEYNLDFISTGRILFFAYEQTKQEKYKKATEVLMSQLNNQPRTKSGNFWHKNIYPNQVWLDGLYMAQPFYMTYDTKFGGKKHYNDIINQFKNVRKFLYDDKKGLYYHAYDEAKVQIWADKETGLSPNFWLRSMGWYLMALIDTMDAMSEEVFDQYKLLEGLFKEAIRGILAYQDEETKLFYQVIDRGDIKENYIETSGSAMIAYAILKGCYMEALSREKYGVIGEQIFNALIKEKLKEVNGKVCLTDCCSVAGLGPKDERDGSIEYYLSEPIVCDEPKAVGVLMMAYAQMLKLQERPY